MSHPYFIAIEGIEGVGKTTLLEVISDFFKKKGYSYTLTREPGGTPLAEDVRTLLKRDGESVDPMTELLLMFAARSHHVQKVIRPLLAEGSSVISDRYVGASYAYQGGGRGIDLSVLQSLDQWVCGDTQADFTFLITCPVEIAMERVQKRGDKDRFEQEAYTFFERAQAAYLALAKGNDRYIIIDGSRPVDVVADDMRQALEQRLL